MKLFKFRLRQLSWLAAISVGSCVVGCDRKSEEGESAKLPASAFVPVGIPVPAGEVARAVNPKQEPPFSGPAGSVEGTISISGAEPPYQAASLAKIERDCAEARKPYERLYRQGNGRALADALVTVTGYKGYVPARGDSVKVEGRGCAWSTRTVALTFGQRLQVVSHDKAYMPELRGSRQPALIATVPGGDPVNLYPTRPGRYVLGDAARPFMNAEVLVMKYATFDVTGMDGRYRIDRIPAGDVTLTAFLPAIMQTSESKLRIESGKTKRVDLTIHYQPAPPQVDAAAAPAADAGAATDAATGPVDSAAR